MAVFPTHDDLALVIVGWGNDDFETVRGDVEGGFLRAIDQAPELAEQVRAGTREERLHVATDLVAYFRKPYGPGWALVGDAGYLLHPITAMGITDAFLDAERLAAALDTAFSGAASYEDAMAVYQRARDEHVGAMYEMTFDIAQLDQPPPPETQQLLAAVAGDPDAMADFVSVQAGTLPVQEFFAPENVGRILGAEPPG
jgi:2-polyprenyl-6-methoxyphenol hydroxylase-like FAD-dependent oxidoreductase